jgi:hypothetical protein
MAVRGLLLSERLLSFSWNEFFFALVIMRENANYTFQLFSQGLLELEAPLDGCAFGRSSHHCSFLSSISSLAMYLIGGLTRGAVNEELRLLVGPQSTDTDFDSYPERDSMVFAKAHKFHRGSGANIALNLRNMLRRNFIW